MEPRNCRFCGTPEPYTEEIEDGTGRFAEGYSYVMICEECQAQGPPGENEENAIEKWNQGSAVAESNSSYTNKKYGDEGIIGDLLQDLHEDDDDEHAYNPSSESEVDGSSSEIKPVALEKNPVALEKDPEALETEIASLKTEVVSLKAKPEALETEIASLKTEVVSLKAEPEALETEIEALKTKIEVLKTESVASKKEKKAIEPKLEITERPLNRALGRIVAYLLNGAAQKSKTTIAKSLYEMFDNSLLEQKNRFEKEMESYQKYREKLQKKKKKKKK